VLAAAWTAKRGPNRAYADCNSRRQRSAAINEIESGLAAVQSAEARSHCGSDFKVSADKLAGILEIRFLADTIDVTFDIPMLSDIAPISVASRQPSLRRSTVNLTESYADGIPSVFSNPNPSIKPSARFTEHFPANNLAEDERKAAAQLLNSDPDHESRRYEWQSVHWRELSDGTGR
jgi:hypothetical protein